MYANVVVLTYQSPDIDSYTYEVPKSLEKEIKVGQLVSVPFGNRQPLGIVLETSAQRPRASIRVKPISSSALHQPIILPYQLDLLKWLRFYYRAPMVNCLEAMLPQLPNAKRLKTNASYSGVERSALSVQQTLILVPSINRLPEVMATYSSAKNPIVYHNELKKSEKFETYLKIKTGQNDFIFGSRSAIFAPCLNLKKIIIYDEHDNAYKDERSPYYDVLTVAEKLQDLTGAKIEIIDLSPKITTYFNHKSALKIGSSPQGRAVPMVKIINMINEKISGNRSALSAYLVTALKKNPGSSLLFLNKKNESGHLYCKSCKHQEFLTIEPETCPHCGSSDFYFNSLNVVSLADLVRKIVPGSNIRIVAEGVNQAAIDYRRSTIDIATASVFYQLLTQRYDLVAHVRADSTLNIVDINSSEKAFTQITDLKKLTSKLLIIQTYNPTNDIIQTASTSNYQKFYNQEISERRMLSYPPFSLLVKLSIRGKKPDLLESKAKMLAIDLKSQPFTVLGPLKPIFAKHLSYNIILKIRLGSYALSAREKKIRELENVLAQVPKDWQITVDPQSIN